MDERLIRRQMQTKAGQDLPLVYLQLGQCIFTGDKMIISTVLGSCVGGTFFHAPTGLAAMFHSMLPCYENRNLPGAKICNFVDAAIDSILIRFMDRNVKTDRLDVCLYGGAFTIQEKSSAMQALLDVGFKNVAMAREVLADMGVRVRHEDVRGSAGRKVIFSTATGESMSMPISR